MPIYSYFPQLFQSITYSRQTTRKLSLSTQLSSEALIAHPTPGTPLNLTLIQPPKQPPSPTALIQPSEQLPSPTALILSPEQPHSPTALKSQPVRRTSHAPHLPHKKGTATGLKSTTVLHKHHPISISPSAQQSSLSIPAHSSADPPPS